MKTYRIFDCTTVDQTNDKVIRTFAWVALLIAYHRTKKTGRLHDYLEESEHDWRYTLNPEYLNL